MKYLEISVGKSMDVNTGSEWFRCDAKVSVGEGEIPEDIFKQVKDEINKWLPNPYQSNVSAVSLPKVTSIEETINQDIEEMNKCTKWSEKNSLNQEIGLSAYDGKWIGSEKFSKAFANKLSEIQSKQ